MLSGSRDTAPVTLFSRADATNLRSLQEQFRSGQTPDDFTPSLNDLLLKLAGAALREHPHIRTQWRDEQLVIPEAFDLAFAVQTPYGLTAPVVRNVPQRSLRELAAETQRLIAGARARRLSAEDLSGAVLTVTNLGHLDVEAFTPILSPPQSVVLGIGKIVREPVVVGEEIDIRDIVRLSMTFDHRVHDGDPAARFLQQVCACIENPGPWLVQ